MPNNRISLTSALVALTLLTVALSAKPSEAQRLRFPSSSPTTTYVPFKTEPLQAVAAKQPIFVANQPNVSLGGIQPIGAPTFDAYANPGAMTTQPVVQPLVQPAPAPSWGGGTTWPSATGQYQFMQPDGTYGSVPRFLQQFRIRHTWINGTGGSPTKMGVNTTEVDGTFLVPFFYLKDPFLITPGFAVHFLEGPAAVDPDQQMPARLYDAYVQLGWQPVITQWLKADLAVRAGVYSDFEKYDNQAIRVLGHGYGVWSHSATTEFRAGVIYLDRLGVKILPAGGVTYMPGGPNGDTRWDFLFPNPKFSWRLRYFGTWDVWWYVAGEYGQGAWAIQRSVPAGTDEVEYRDYRLITGLEWTTVSGIKGFVEAGWVFGRELEYRSAMGNTDLSDTFMLRGGITF